MDEERYQPLSAREIEGQEVGIETVEIRGGETVNVVSGWLPLGETEEIVSTFEVGIQERTPPLDALVSRMGGKSQLKAWLVDRFPRDVKTYVEPFMGSVQVFLARSWKNPIEIINDVDADLVHFYRYAVFNPEKLVTFINEMPTHEGIILGLRRALKQGSLSGLERAAAFYICSASSFNAIISNHVTRYASSPHVLVNTKVDLRSVRAVADRLRCVDIRCTTYGRVLDSVIKEVHGGLFVYMDPPYDQTEGYSTFDDKLSFDWKDHVQLAECCDRIHAVGGRFIQTNSSTERLKELYGSRKEFHLISRAVYYSASGVADKRKEAEELIISNFELTDNQRRMF